MPDLPIPQDAAEAAEFTEVWDAVLSYADLCTSGSAAGAELAAEAFTRGIGEARAAEATAGGAGRRTPRLPRIPLLLTAVRTTAAEWEARGLGHRLDPDLRLWLHAEKAARYTGPPLRRPLALRALRDMQEPDAALLWLAEAESLPLPHVARRLGLDPSATARELDQVRALFRDRCHRNHLDAPLDAECRAYAGLLDVVTRTPGTDTPGDLSRHLAVCVECAEAAACLRVSGGGLSAALTGGVIGWGGLAYLERRRRAAEAGLSGGRVDAAADTGLAVGTVTRPRIGRTGILAGAVLVSALALTVSLMQSGTSDESAVARDTAAERPAAEPSFSLPPTTRPSPGEDVPGASSTSRPAAGSATRATQGDRDPEPQGEPSGTARSARGAGERPEAPATGCEVAYEIVNAWPDGFQATVTVTSPTALTDWRVGWTFGGDQRVTQVWDAALTQSGPRVTATAADYNKNVAAGGTFALGFLGAGSGAAPHDFTLNGGRCRAAG
ncbi:cellulose binding domain-containing protein [Streptomyces griseoaurantiacus]|uniref:cellulose binding domain-containing protein n=1 Tax=Streptomyces griseoaurantiacus TaxID=68213 RepID=UPI003460D2AF